MWQWRFVRLSVGQMGRGGCMWVEGRNQSFLTGCLSPLPAPRTSACTTCSTCACNSASCSTITEVQPHPPLPGSPPSRRWKNWRFVFIVCQFQHECWSFNFNLAHSINWLFSVQLIKLLSMDIYFLHFWNTVFWSSKPTFLPLYLRNIADRLPKKDKFDDRVGCWLWYYWRRSQT